MDQPANFQRLYDNLQAAVTGALFPMFQAELFEVVRDFCQETGIFNQTQDITVSRAGGLVYGLLPPITASIKRLLGVQDITGTNLTNGPPFPKVSWPMGLVLPNSFTLYQLPNNTYTWRVQYSMYPIDPPDANGNPVFPSWILDNYFDALAAGVRWRMHVQTAKPYSNPALAASFLKVYRAGRGLAMADVLRQNVYGAQAWCFPSSYATYGRQRGV